MVDDRRLAALVRHARRAEDERLADLVARALAAGPGDPPADRELAERVLASLCRLLGLADDEG